MPCKRRDSSAVRRSVPPLSAKSQTKDRLKMSQTNLEDPSVHTPFADLASTCVQGRPSACGAAYRCPVWPLFRNTPVLMPALGACQAFFIKRAVSPLRSVKQKNRPKEAVHKLHIRNVCRRHHEVAPATQSAVGPSAPPMIARSSGLPPEGAQAQTKKTASNASRIM